MATSKLESMIQDPDVFSLGIDSSPVKDILLEIASRVDNLQYRISKVPSEKENDTKDEIRSLSVKVNEVAKQCDRQTADFTGEVRELKSFFQFQIKELKERLEKTNKASAKEQFSEPTSNTSTGPPTPKTKPQTPVSVVRSDDNAIKKLEYDMDSLKSRIESIFSIVNTMKESTQSGLQIEALPTDTTEESFKEIQTIETPQAPEQPAKLKMINRYKDEPISKLTEDDIPKSQRVESPVKDIPREVENGDPRVNEILEQIENLFSDRKVDKDKITNITKTTNKIITELDAQHKDIQVVKREASTLTEEFNKVYQKIADSSFEQDSKVSSVKNLVDALFEEQRTTKEDLTKDISALKSHSKQGSEQLDLSSIINEVKKTVAESLQDMDTNYRKQIHYLKQEITNLKMQLAGTPELEIPENVEPEMETIQASDAHGEETPTVEEKSHPTIPVPTRPNQLTKSVSQRNPSAIISQVRTSQASLIKAPRFDVGVETDISELNPIPIERVSFATPLAGSLPNSINYQFIVERPPPRKPGMVALPQHRPQAVDLTPEELQGTNKRVVIRKDPKFLITVTTNTPVLAEGSESEVLKAEDGVVEVRPEDQPDPNPIPIRSRKNSSNGTPRSRKDSTNGTPRSPGQSRTLTPGAQSSSGSSSNPNFNASQTPSSSSSKSNGEREDNFAVTRKESKVKFDTNLVRNDTMTTDDEPEYEYEYDEVEVEEVNKNGEASHTNQDGTPVKTTLRVRRRVYKSKSAEIFHKTQKPPSSSTLAPSKQKATPKENANVAKPGMPIVEDDKGVRRTSTEKIKIDENGNVIEGELPPDSELLVIKRKRKRQPKMQYADSSIQADQYDYEYDYEEEEGEQVELIDRVVQTDPVSSLPTPANSALVSRNDVGYIVAQHLDHYHHRSTTDAGTGEAAGKQYSSGGAGSHFSNDGHLADDVDDSMAYLESYGGETFFTPSTKGKSVTPAPMFTKPATPKVKQEAKPREIKFTMERMLTMNIVQELPSQKTEVVIPKDFDIEELAKMLNDRNKNPRIRAMEEIISRHTGEITSLYNRMEDIPNLIAVKVADIRTMIKNQLEPEITVEKQDGTMLHRQVFHQSGTSIAPTKQVPKVNNIPSAGATSARDSSRSTGSYAPAPGKFTSVAEVQPRLGSSESIPPVGDLNIVTIRKKDNPYASSRGSGRIPSITSGSFGSMFAKGKLSFVSDSDLNSQNTSASDSTAPSEPASAKEHPPAIESGIGTSSTATLPAELNFAKRFTFSSTVNQNDVDVQPRRQFTMFSTNQASNPGTQQQTSGSSDESQQESLIHQVDFDISPTIQQVNQEMLETRDSEYRDMLGQQGEKMDMMQYTLSTYESTIYELEHKIEDLQTRLGKLEKNFMKSIKRSHSHKPHDFPKPKIDTDSITVPENNIEDEHKEDLPPANEEEPASSRRNEEEEERNVLVYKMQFVSQFSVDNVPIVQTPTHTEMELDTDNIKIPRYEDQIRIMRDNLVDIRTSVQLLKKRCDEEFSKLPETHVALASDLLEQQEEKVGLALFTQNNKRIGSKMQDLAQIVYDLRTEFYQFMKDRPDRIIERIVEVPVVQQVQDKEVKKKKKKEKPLPAVPKLDEAQIDLSINRNKKIIGNLSESPRVFDAIPLEVPEVSDDETSESTPIVEDRTQKNSSRPRPAAGHNRRVIFFSDEDDDLPVKQSSGADNDSEETKPQTPKDASDAVGHAVPQVVDEVYVQNALPKGDFTDALVPLLMKLKAELMIHIDNANDRTRRCTKDMNMKLDKDVAEKFFQKVRVYLVDMKDGLTRMRDALPERVTKEELREAIDSLYSQVAREPSPSAGVNVTRCLFCGQVKKSAPSRPPDPNPSAIGQRQSYNPAPFVSTRDKVVYRGRQSSQAPIPAPASEVQAPPQETSCLPKL